MVQKLVLASDALGIKALGSNPSNALFFYFTVIILQHKIPSVLQFQAKKNENTHQSSKTKKHI